MSLETSKKILKVFGILGIIFGILTLLGGLVVLLGGTLLAGLASSVQEDDLGMLAGGISFIAALLISLSGFVMLLEGIFSVNASKDSNKIMPAWIFAILGMVSAISGLVSAVVALFSESGGEITTLISPILTVIINSCVFTAANTIKKSR